MPVELRKNEATTVVFVEASRDSMAVRPIRRLEPDDRYATIYSRQPLPADRLRMADVLVIAGNMADTCTDTEKKATVRFVKAGGGLLLAGSTGTFERYSGRPVGELAVAGIGRLFGIEFLSPTEAAGSAAEDPALVKG